MATATGAALFNMECTVYMGAEDMKRQSLNVMRMEMLGAKVVPVTSGSNTLRMLRMRQFVPGQKPQRIPFM